MKYHKSHKSVYQRYEFKRIWSLGSEKLEKE